MSFSINIPALGNVGSSHFGNIPLSEHRVVVGQNTNVLTLADTVSIDVRTQYQIPIMLPADRLLCLSSSGEAFSSRTICNRADRYKQAIPINGMNYVVLG